MNAADQDLLTRARSGDDRALEEILTRYAPAIYRFGMKMCRDPEDAKDIAQETLFAAARNLRDFRGASSLSTWLYTVARSFCIKRRRSSKFAPEQVVPLEHAAPEELAAREPAPDEAAAGHETTQALERAIAALEPGNREVLVLRDVEGLTAPEVAEVLGVSVDAVKSRLHRARAEVRAQLGAVLEFPEPSSLGTAKEPCPNIVELFSRYVEGEIGEAECKAMERHVTACPRCRSGCDSLKQTLQLCRTQPTVEVPPEIQELVRNAVRELVTSPR